jgi:hypothetical protein
MESSNEKFLNFLSVVPISNNIKVNILNELSNFSKPRETDYSSDPEIVCNELPNPFKSNQHSHFEAIHSDPISDADSEEYSEIFVTNLNLTK